MKSNKADKIFGYFIAIFFAGCGMLSLYRATLTENDLVMLNGILKSAKVVEVTSYGSKGGKKHSYPITLKFEGDKQLYGFYVSNKNKAEDMLRSINFEIGERYSIFYDPTVVAGFANVKQGVQKIKVGDKVILEETNFRNKVLGVFMLGFSTILFLVIMFADKIKKRFAKRRHSKSCLTLTNL